MTATTAYALLVRLASEHASHVAKIKCLYAARSAPEVTPQQRACASFAAARLLVHHHASSERVLEEAKSLLLSAERDLKSSHASTSSYLATLSMLGQVHLLLGDDASAVSAFQLGAREAAAGAGATMGATTGAKMEATTGATMEATEATRWQAHFLLFLARVDPSEKRVGEHLRAAEALKIDDPVNKTVLALSQAIVAMQRNDTELADQHLTTTATELGGALRRSSAAQSASKHCVESLRAHYYLLYALNAQLSGRTAQLASEGSYPAFDEFFKAVDRLDKMAGNEGVADFETFFSPLDDGELKACGDMMYENVLRMSDGGVVPMETGERATTNATTASTTTGHKKSVQQLEYEAMRALAVCDFRQAAKTLVEAVHADRANTMHDASAISKSGFKPGFKWGSKSLPLLIGEYFHSTREYDAALALLTGPLLSGDPRAAPRAALVELERNDVSAAASRMVAHKDAIDMDALPTHERAVVQMVNGLVLLRQDDTTGARLLLTKALKQAHGMVGSGQFVGQILNCLAPVQQLRHDHSGALQMLESAATLLKSAKDVMSLVTTLVCMEKLYLAMKQHDKAASCRQYLEKKNAELTKRLQLVHSTSEHKELVYSFSMQ